MLNTLCWEHVDALLLLDDKDKDDKENMHGNAYAAPPPKVTKKEQNKKKHRFLGAEVEVLAAAAEPLQLPPDPDMKKKVRFVGVEVFAAADQPLQLPPSLVPAGGAAAAIIVLAALKHV